MTMQRVDYILFVLLGALVVVSALGSIRIANAVYELAERTILVQCECP